jgi:hypothetical protein
MESTLIQKNIYGYLVELEIDPSVEWSDCWIMKDGFSGSLAFAHMHGELINDYTGETLEIKPDALALITKWAERNGY